jgi:serine/threonine protein kinase
MSASANVLLDRGCTGRIGDFGIAKSLSNAGGVTATHMHTNQAMGTQVYMSPEYKNGQISTKVDSFAFGLVVLEALTAYPISAPPGHMNLLSMFEDALDTSDKLGLHLDKRVCWHQHTKAEHVNTLHCIVERCLESRRNRRPEMVDLIPELEKVRRDTESLLPLPAAERPSDGKECVVCLAEGANVERWMMLQPCGHVCVCLGCGQGLRECPLCRQTVIHSFPAFL